MTNEKTKINKIKKLALKRGTPLVHISRNGKAVSFQYKAGTRLKGYSYANIEKAIPAELKRLAVK